MSTTLNHTGNAADVCRERGWTVGTRLVGDEGYGPTVIEITAIGRNGIMAACLAHAGAAVAPQEGSWVLWCRDWREAAPSEVPDPLPFGALVVSRTRSDLRGVIESGPDHDGCYVIAGPWGRARVKNPILISPPSAARPSVGGTEGDAS